MKLFLFHDHEALAWTPFVETRPVGEMLYGTLSLRERAERALGCAVSGYLGAPHLAGFDEPGSPPQLDGAADPDHDRLFLSARAVLEPLGGPPPTGPTTLYLDGRVAGWLVPAGAPAPGPDRLAHPQADSGDRLKLRGEILGRPWELMAKNAARTAADIDHGHPGNDAFQLTDVHLIGDHRVLLSERAVIDPGAVLDTRAGPIWLDHDARVEAPARITGPLYLGPGSTVLGGQVGSSSIGPACKVRGEVSDSVILGYSNKAHDGHLGHAVLGRWVNLGAGTTNSDLKNTYGSIRLRLADGEVDTGLLKCGAFLGDHVKTGIGTLLNTGTVIGAASNIFGGKVPPAYVPPFSWGEGVELVEYRLDRFLATAELAMRRRGVELTDGMRRVLTRIAERSRAGQTPTVAGFGTEWSRPETPPGEGRRQR